MGLLVQMVGKLPLPWVKAVARAQWRHPVAKRAFDFASRTIRKREGVIQRGAGKGLRFHAGGSTAGMLLGTLEPELQLAFETFLQPGMTLYDIGANVGFFSVVGARLVGSTGRVLAFEPVDSTAAQARANAGRNAFAHVTVEATAVGDRDGRALFAFSGDSNWGRLASVHGTPGAPLGHGEVRITRLDSFRTRGGPPPDVIKIDVEGGEVEVLEGARETLRAARPILFIDLHGTNEPVGRLLDELDYEIWLTAGRRTDVAAEPWNAQIMALPRERADALRPLAERLAPAGAPGKARRRTQASNRRNPGGYVASLWAARWTGGAAR
jgi:FkbM family methyltransferase